VKPDDFTNNSNNPQSFHDVIKMKANIISYIMVATNNVMEQAGGCPCPT
jgi:hypothetical protein